MSVPSRADPYPNHRFQVEIDDFPIDGIAEVRGLTVSVEVRASETEPTGDTGWETLTEAVGPGLGNLETAIRDRIGEASLDETVGAVLPEAFPPAQRRRVSPHLELRRGVTDDRAFWNWLQDWVDGGADPRTVRIHLLDQDGEPARGWRCRDATPTRWSGPELTARRSGVAMETLELAHDGIEPMDPDDIDG